VTMTGKGEESRVIPISTCTVSHDLAQHRG
jgi:hypothetical protein